MQRLLVVGERDSPCGHAWQRRAAKAVVMCALTVLAASSGARLEAAPPSATGGPRVHVNESDARSYHVNAHWVESDRGIVLIDTLLLKSDAQRLAERIKARGKPLLAILITHPHLDHISGTRMLRAHFGPVPVCATRATAESIPRAVAKAVAQGWLKPFGDDHDPDIVLPDCLIESGSDARFGDMVFRVQDLGSMESENNTVFYLDSARALFGGDATVSNAIYFVGDGRSQQALTGLRALETRYAADTQVYSGHYQPRELGPLIQDNIRQIERMRAALESVRAESGALTEAGLLTAAARTRVLKQLVDAAEDRAGYGMDLRMVASMNLQGLMREWREDRRRNADDAAKGGAK